LWRPELLPAQEEREEHLRLLLEHDHRLPPVLGHLLLDVHEIGERRDVETAQVDGGRAGERRAIDRDVVGGIAEGHPRLRREAQAVEDEGSGAARPDRLCERGDVVVRRGADEDDRVRAHEPVAGGNVSADLELTRRRAASRSG
jgi:hypothetical protein